MTYTVRKYNGDYPMSIPYMGKDKDIAIAVASAYIVKDAKIEIIETREKETPHANAEAK